MKNPILKYSCLSGVSLLASSASAADKITYADHIRPIFENKCFSCHNPDKAKGGLDLTNYGGTMTGSSGGEIVSPGNPGDSSLFLTVTKQAEPFMPPKGEALSKAQTDLIAKWIEGGVLDTSSSTARKAKKPAFDMTVSADATGKPEGPPPMPEHLLLEPVVLTPRPAAAAAMAASPWAPLAAISGQKQVLLYNTDNLQIEGVLPFPEGFVESLRFSRNGSLVIAGGGRGGKAGKVVGWEVKTGKRVIDVGSEFDTVLASDISPDHSLVALGSTGKKLKIYNTVDGSELHAIKKHTDWITSLAFSNDGILVASGDRAGNLYVWEAQTGILFHDLRGHSGAITGISWRADSNILATASEDKTIRLWEMNEGKEVKKWDAHGTGTLSLDFHRNGQLVSVGRDRNAKVFDQAGKQLAAFKDFRDLPLLSRFTHDGERILVGDWYGEISVWSKDGKTKIGVLPANPPSIAGRIESTTAEIAKAEAAAAESRKKLEAAVAALNAQKQATEASRKTMDAKNNDRAAKETAFSQAQQKAQQALAARDAAQKDLDAKKADPNATAAVAPAEQLLAQRNKELNEANQAVGPAKAAFDEAHQQSEAAKAEFAKNDEALKKQLEAEKPVRAEADGANNRIAALKNNLVRWQAAVINTERLEKASQIPQLEADLEFATADLQTVEKEFTDLAAATEAASKGIGEAKSLIQTKQQILDKAVARKPQAESDVRLHQVIVNNAVNAHHLLSQSKADTEEMKKKFDEAAKAAEQAVTSAQNHLSQLQSEVEHAIPNAEKALADAKNQLTAVEKDVAEKQAVLAALETKKNELASKRGKIEADLTALRKETENLKQRYLDKLAGKPAPAPSKDVAGK